jgi:hypothetical protein
MVADFLSTGGEASDLGEGFSDLGESASDLPERLNKTGGGGGGAGGGGGKSGEKGLGDIFKLLDDNLKEMRTYAFVK